MKLVKGLIGVLVIWGLVVLVGCSSSLKIGTDGLPENMADVYRGSVGETHGYFFHDNGKLIFDHNKSQITDGDRVFEYKIIPENKLEDESRGNISLFEKQTKGKNVYFMIIRQIREDGDPTEWQSDSGYEIILSQDSKNININALDLDFESFQFTGRAE